MRSGLVPAVRLHTLFFVLVVLLPSIYAVAQEPERRDSAGLVNYAHSAEYEIAAIDVSGPPGSKVDKTYISYISGFTVGDRVAMPGPRFASAIRKLWAEKVFSDVRIYVTKIQDGKIYLNIYVEEKPRLTRFTFRGIPKGQQDDLRDKIKLFKGEVVNEHLIMSTRYRIQDFYADKGFLAARVDVEEVPDTAGVEKGVLLRFTIDKGEKVRIRRIEIEGNEALDDYEVKRVMKKTIEGSRFEVHKDLLNLITRPKETFRAIRKDEEKYHFYQLVWKYIRTKARLNIFKSSKFIESDYEEDKENVIRAYNKKGFRDAMIEWDTVIIQGSDIIIKMRISEGRKFYLRNISWIGNTKFRTEELQKIAGLQKGDLYDRERIESVINFNPNGVDISSLYQDNGYLFFQITPVETAVVGDSVDLEFRIYEGRQARVNRVTVSGNTKTSDHVILREVRTRPGDLFSRADIIRTQQELSQLGYFNAQAMNVLPKPNPQDGTVDIEYVVEEQPNDQVELSGGWGNRMLVGTLGVTFNNFSTRNFFNKDAWKPVPSGDGQRLSVRLMSNGRFFQSYNISFTEPWLGGKKPLAFTLGAFHSLNNLGNLAGTSGRIMSTSVFSSLGQRLRWPDDFFNILLTLRYERYNLRNYMLIPNFSNGTSHKLSLAAVLSRNSTNEFIFPSRGSDLSVSAEGTLPYSLMRPAMDYASRPPEERYKLLEYYKFKFSAKFYSGLGGNKLSQKLVMYNRLEGGVLGAYNTALGAPPFERFLVGGDGLSAIGFNNQFLGREVIALRGYRDGTLTPGYSPTTPPTGGTAYAKMTTELRFLISGNPSAKIFVLAFMEAGNAWDSFREFSTFRVNRSVGGGLRLFLPMFGLLGIDYGYGFDPIRNTPESARQKGVFHFMIGQQF